MKRSTIWAIVFALIGFTIPIAFNSPATGTSEGDDWTQLFFGAALCPPVILVAMSATDPSLGLIWFMVAPLNALLYGAGARALARKLERKNERWV